MTTAILSFRTAGQVRLRCARPGIDEVRPLEASPPFAAWASEYAAAQHHPDEMLRLLELGLAIGAWLDDGLGWLTRLLKEAPPPLILEIEASSGPGSPDAVEPAALEAPWELIAQPGIGHLALHDYVRLSPVRRLDVPGAARPRSPCRLSVLFMAAQPGGVTALDFEREEARLTTEVKRLGPDPFDLFVEETGTLNGLATAARRAAAYTVGADPAGPVDVLHVSCHGTGGDRPGLLLEDDTGAPVATTGAELAHALAEHVPALTVIAACSTTEASTASRSLATELCRQGWPAVLGWAGPLDDRGAAWLSARLYHKLAQRSPLTDALAWCRCDAASPGRPPRRVWHQARLFLGRAGGGPIGGGIVARQPAQAGQRSYLDRAHRVPIARDDEFVGRRRAVQHVHAALLRGATHGAVLSGAPQLGKSSLAAQICRRRPDLQPVVVSRVHDAAAILAAIATALPAGAVEVIARHRPPGPWDAASFGNALRELLAGPCATAGAGAILLILDGFEQVLVPPRAPAAPATVRDELAPTIAALIAAFTGARTASRLLFTSRYRFAVPGEHDEDLTDQLWHEPLDPMDAGDLAKQVRASTRGGATLGRADLAARAARHAAAIELCLGNPGLLQILLAIVARTPAIWPALCVELRALAAAATPVEEEDLAAATARVALGHLIGALAPGGRADLSHELAAWQPAHDDLPAFEVPRADQRLCACHSTEHGGC